ncbi:hypothetical protein [Bradyrhizobium sp. 150]|uniref:hypothetical protein n=1 Tax=Bradyrhizobium sp. 150 TaxID=2782625 RepID=UPI001FF8E398|nr:hypothetical protein [Bradyrhizobium sp. 150]MCK1670372.1 hypothetical protein [Bradyrhizobium sp. 150]
MMMQESPRMPRMSKLLELLGTYSVQPTSGVGLDVHELREKVRTSPEFSPVEVSYLLRAIDWCVKQQPPVPHV